MWFSILLFVCSALAQEDVDEEAIVKETPQVERTVLIEQEQRAKELEQSAANLRAEAEKLRDLLEALQQDQALEPIEEAPPTPTDAEEVDSESIGGTEGAEDVGELECVDDLEDDLEVDPLDDSIEGDGRGDPGSEDTSILNHISARIDPA